MFSLAQNTTTIYEMQSFIYFSQRVCILVIVTTNELLYIMFSSSGFEVRLSLPTFPFSLLQTSLSPAASSHAPTLDFFP